MKNLLTTTAVIMSLAAPALAESHSTTTTESTATDSTMATEVDTAMDMEIGSVMAQPTDLFASDLIGMNIYNVDVDMDPMMEVADGAETEWEDIGEINDIIVTADGQVSAVILGVGGFLGIGESDVSVPMAALNIVQEEGDSDDFFIVVKTSREMLEAAPAFNRDNM